MTKLTFETATLADVLKRACAVAPTRGDAFDKAAGVVFRIRDGSITVLATDTLVFYTEAVNCIFSATGTDETIWRIPSIILGSIVSKLPMGSGSTVELEDESERPKIVLRCGKTVAKFNLLDEKYYPLWSPTDPGELTTVSGFGAAVKQVLWATSNAEPTLSGVALFPDSVCATDRIRMARVELATGLDDVCVIPGKVISRVVPDQGEVRIGMVGGNFMLCPNEYTQIRTVVLAEAYPDIRRVLDRDFEATSHFSQSQFAPMLTRALDFTQGDRQAKVTVFLGKGEVALYLDNKQVGLFGDIIDATGDAEDHNRLKINFLPDNLRDAIATFPGEVITIKYNLDRKTAAKAAISFTNEANYISLVQPLRESEPKKDEEE